MDKYVTRTPPTPQKQQLLQSRPQQLAQPTTPQLPRNQASPIKSDTQEPNTTPDHVLKEFDAHCGRKWIYPNNMSVRPYQKQAVEMGLFKNAMIVLPTGFGKTFIAAVVMYNFYRWYPTGKIIFVAPTRPLVTQQMVECKKISGIPKNDCIELTGQTHKEKRLVLWRSKRVFFATPQVIENDLKENILPSSDVRCVVLDEAHRAQGGYAYVGIVRNLHEANPNGFRVMALSATPGSDIQRVQQVMLNLYISDVMFRTENSIDLTTFKNQKLSQAWTVALPPKHQQLVDQFIKICDPVVKELYRAGMLFNADTLDRVPKYALVKAMKAGYSNDAASTRISKGKLCYLVSSALSMTHHFELLALYGIRVFYSSVSKNLLTPRSPLKTAFAASVEFTKMLDTIKGMFGEDTDLTSEKTPKADILQGHPKLTVVKDLLLKHFNQKQEQEQSTRAIVFSKYVESVHDIVQCLKAYDPIIKPAVFVGQSGMKQKDQIDMVKAFKDGKYNVIVATCVAEEGLDIGEVDLIICYDTTSSPISNTQRRGRTGRKRAGDVQTLCTKGYEEKRLSKAGQSRRQVEDQLFRRENYMSHRYRHAPKMVPDHIKPECLEQKIYPLEDEDDDKSEVKPKRKRQKKLVVDPKKKKGCCEETSEDLTMELSSDDFAKFVKKEPASDGGFGFFVQKAPSEKGEEAMGATVKREPSDDEAVGSSSQGSKQQISSEEFKPLSSEEFEAILSQDFEDPFSEEEDSCTILS